MFRSLLLILATVALLFLVLVSVVLIGAARLRSQWASDAAQATTAAPAHDPSTAPAVAEAAATAPSTEPVKPVAEEEADPSPATLYLPALQAKLTGNAKLQDHRGDVDVRGEREKAGRDKRERALVEKIAADRAAVERAQAARGDRVPADPVQGDRVKGARGDRVPADRVQDDRVQGARGDRAQGDRAQPQGDRAQGDRVISDKERARMEKADARVRGTEGTAEERRVRAQSRVWIAEWHEEGDTAEWDVQAAVAGAYEVDLVYACPPRSGGEFTITVGDQTIACKTQASRGTDDYRMVTVGNIVIPAGKTTLTIRPKASGKTPLMNLKSVKLIPAT